MAVSGNAVPTMDDLSDFVSTFVKRRFEETGIGVTGAIIAAAVREHFPPIDLKQSIGEHWLADVVRHAAASGKLVRNHTVKHLEAYPPSSESRHQDCSRTTNAPSLRSRVFVKPDLWRAIMFVHQSQRSYFRKSDQQVLSAPTTHSIDDDDVVEIDSIPSDVQKQWMHEFVASHEVLTEKDAPFESKNWWVAFPEWLRTAGASFEADWKRFRTKKVVQHIRDWALSNGIREETILSPARPQRSRERSIESGIGIASHTSNRSEPAIRKALLCAVNEMTLDELYSISIPIRCILRHFDPR